MRTCILAAVIVACLSPSLAHAESGRQVDVVSFNEPEPYMWTMTKDTFFGGVFGALIGGAVMLVTRFEADPMIMAYTTGGGMALGAGFGVWEVVDRRNQVRGPETALRRDGEVGVAWSFTF